MRRPFALVALLCSGLLACTDPAASDPPAAVSLSPATVSLAPGDTATFSATVAGPAEGGITWHADAGTLEPRGSDAVWIAPLEAGTFTIEATADADPSARATATATVVAPPGTQAHAFSQFRGTRQTMPPGMFASGENGAGVAIGPDWDPFTGVVDARTAAFADFDGFNAYTNGSGGYSFGMRERGTSDLRESRLFLQYRNTADRPIVAFHVSYVVEVWALGERANRIRFKVGLDTVGFGAIDDLASTDNPRGRAAGSQVGVVVDGTLPENRERVTLRVDLPHVSAPDGRPIGSLVPDEDLYFRWQYSNADGDAGEHRSALALADLRVVPIYAGTTHGPLEISHESGFQDPQATLTMASGLPGSRIYYTIDGSEPDPARIMSDDAWEAIPAGERQRTFLYEGPVAMAQLRADTDVAYLRTTRIGEPWAWQRPREDPERAVVLRAVALGRRNSRSAAEHRTFIMAPPGRFDLRVVSVITPEPGLFSNEHGIYVPGPGEVENYLNRGDEWERDAIVEYFDEHGLRHFSTHAGIRIHGGHSRHVARKPLRVYPRGNSGFINYPLFDSRYQNVYGRFILRNSGNDMPYGLLRDQALQTLVQHLGFDTQHHRPVVVFLNGIYWGLHEMRDRFDTRFFEARHGIPRANVTIIDETGQVADGNPASRDSYLALEDDVASGRLASYAAVSEFMDLDSYLDYLVAQLYAGNRDWPHNNMEWWRNDGPRGNGAADGRWRWVMYDVDHSFALEAAADVDMISHLLDSPEHPWSRELVRGLMSIDEVRHSFLQRIALHCATTFRPDRVQAHIEAMARQIQREVPVHIARWGTPQDVGAWTAEVAVMTGFARDRPAFLRQHAADYFSEVAGMATLQVAGVTSTPTLLYGLPINGATPGVAISGGTWQAEVFLGVPLEVTAPPAAVAGAVVEGEARVLARHGSTLRMILDGPAAVRWP